MKPFSPYLMITSKCNYKCRHCCFSCSKRGQHMSMEVVEQSLKRFSDCELLVIGGGEPTLHPQFWDIIKLCKEHGYFGKKLWMCSNGSQKEIMRKLSKMADKEEIRVSISDDTFHPPLDEEVKKWFTDTEHHFSSFDHFKSIQNVIDPMPLGRWKGQPSWRKGECCCEGPFIKPNGKVYQCGCPRGVLIGDVWSVCRPKPIDEFGGSWEYCSNHVRKIIRLRKSKKELAGEEA